MQLLEFGLTAAKQLSAFLKSLRSQSLLRKRYYKDTCITDRLTNRNSNSLKMGTSSEL